MTRGIPLMDPFYGLIVNIVGCAEPDPVSKPSVIHMSVNVVAPQPRNCEKWPCRVYSTWRMI